MFKLLKDKEENMKKLHKSYFKNNGFIIFCLSQLILLLISIGLRFYVQNNVSLQVAFSILIIFDEILCITVFLKYFRRKNVIGEKGKIKEECRNTIFSWYLKRLLLLFLVYVGLNICISILFSNIAILAILNKYVLVIFELILYIEVILAGVILAVEVFLRYRYVLLWGLIFTLLSYDDFGTFLVSTLYVGLISWLISSESIAYFQIEFAILANKDIATDNQTKKFFSKVKSQMIFLLISFNLSSILTRELLRINKILEALRDFCRQTYILAVNDVETQDRVIYILVKFILIFLIYIATKYSVNQMFQKGSFYTLPINTRIFNKYDELFIVEYSKVLGNYSSGKIKYKKYYLSRLFRYIELTHEKYIYVCFDNDSIFDYYVSTSLYKILDKESQVKYQKFKTKKLMKQINILNKAMENLSYSS